MKKLFLFLAAALSLVMCAVVTYYYFYIKALGENFATSAPPYVAFFYAIPFAVGIVLCLILSMVFRKR